MSNIKIDVDNLSITDLKRFILFKKVYGILAICAGFKALFISFHDSVKYRSKYYSVPFMGIGFFCFNEAFGSKEEIEFCERIICEKNRQ